MKSTTSWSCGEADLFPRALASLFQLSRHLEDGEPTNAWVPVVDISEDEKGYTVKAELPDIPKESVKVVVENRMLTLSGERQAEKDEKGKRFHRREIVYGKFSRSFGLPEDADAESVKADFKNGILLVTVPKSEKAKPREVSVQVN